MSGGAHQFAAGWGGDEDGESDFFSEFFGPLSSEFPAKANNSKSAAAAPHHKNNSNDRAGDGGAAVNEEEVESSGNRFGDHGKRRGASTSGGSKGKEEAGASCDSHHKRKRKRTTEMHNMTERRRRDKIKGKLKALQELVPNSHKLDRASLLDEAVAYLKSLQMHVNTLQMQVQMMSGGGLCHMPPLPGACLHMSAFSHFSPMDPIGAYGMGMASMGCPVGPPLMSLPSPNMVPLAGLGTIPSFGPRSQGVPFPLIPEFTVATSSSIPSPPILQAGPFSLHRAEAGSQETVAAQVHPGWMIARK